MNQDNKCLFNANLMNELKYVYVCYVYDSMHDYDYDHVGTHVRLCMRIRALDALRQVQVMYRASYEHDTDDDLRFPLIVRFRIVP
jgi:predicted metal-dependent hydrolase